MHSREQGHRYIRKITFFTLNCKGVFEEVNSNGVRLLQFSQIGKPAP